MSEQPGRRVERLKPVAELARGAEQRSATHMAGAERRQVESGIRLLELQRYRQEYQLALEQRASGGVNARQLREYQNFMARLQQAIETQRKEHERLRGETSRARAALTENSKRRKTLGKLVDKLNREERYMDDRRLQNDSDERAQRSRRKSP